MKMRKNAQATTKKELIVDNFFSVYRLMLTSLSLELNLFSLEITFYSSLDPARKVQDYS